MGGIGLTLILLIVVALTILAAATLWWRQRIGLLADAQRFPPPGQWIAMDGCRWHIDASGEGHPPVVFEAGIGATSLSWRLVQPEIAKRTQAISYDRACLGWSDDSARPRDLGQVAQELRDLLERAEVAAPRILVAHSYGAMVAIAYTARYRRDVAGIVFVDPVSVPAWCEPADRDLALLRRGIALSRRGVTLTKLGVTRFGLGLLSGGARAVPQMIAKAAGGRGSGFLDRMAGQVQKLPPEVLPMIQAHWCNPKSFEGMARYLEMLPESAGQARGDLWALTDVPLMVLSAERASGAERQWHRELAARSVSGEMRVIEGSGHWIQLDRPDAVIEAVGEMMRRCSVG